jgi:hypothetical protein
MDNQDHKATRPNFLCRGPGLLDFIYNAWRKATEILTPESTQESNFPYKVDPPSERHPE